MNLCAIVPWGTDHGQRQRIWDRMLVEWDQLGIPMRIATDPLHGKPGHPFSLGHAVNNAMSKMSPLYDAFIVWGADQLPDADAMTWACQRLNAGRSWTLPFSSIVELDEQGTDDYLFGRNLNNLPWRQIPSHPDVPGIVAFTRDAWDRVGGFDERYTGWGYEDTDLVNRLARDIEPRDPQRYDKPLRCLWHGNGDPIQRREVLTDANPNHVLFRSIWG